MDRPEISDLSGHIGRKFVPLAIGCFEGGEWSRHLAAPEGLDLYEKRMNAMQHKTLVTYLDRVDATSHALWRFRDRRRFRKAFSLTCPRVCSSPWRFRNRLRFRNFSDHFFRTNKHKATFQTHSLSISDPVVRDSTPNPLNISIWEDQVVKHSGRWLGRYQHMHNAALPTFQNSFFQPRV